MREGELIAERFSLEKLAGRGGMGEVYRARDVESGETVALKLLRADAGNETQRFMREARVLEKLDHPAIVRHIAHGVTAGGELFLAMRWLEGEDLATRLDRGPLSTADTLVLAGRACAALSAAHQAGVVHRDLKPHNLFLCGGAMENATLLDFGIARVAMTQAKTRTGAMLGTPAYMSPEQARGESALDQRCDVWALGAVLYECLTGQPPFTGDHVMAILAKVLFEPAPALFDVLPSAPPRLSQLIARMLTRAVDARPKDMDEVLSALRSVEAEPLPAAAAKPLRLGGGEQRRLFVALAAPAKRAPEPLAQTASPGLDDTAPSAPRLSLAWGVRERLAKDYRAQIEALIDGSVVAVLTSEGSASDSAGRAARCALALREALPTANVGLATGRGVVSGALPVGDVIDRAARLLIAPGETARLSVDEGTAALLEGRFELDPQLGVTVLLKEAHAPETVRTLLGRPTPCIGRDRELATLNGVLAECTNEPASRAVLVTAPPGTGKSRLRFELHKQIARDGRARVWVARGDPMSAGSAFGMLRQLLRQAAQIESGDPLERSRARLLERVRACVHPDLAPRVAAFLGELAGVPFEGSLVELRAARDDAALMAQQTRRAFEDWLAGECRDEPVVLVLEDLHWGDRATVALLDHALEALRDLPLMVLALARPEVKTLFEDIWADRGVLELELQELSRKSSERLARQVLGERATQDMLDRITALAQGNAFYLEELIRAVAEGRGGTLPDSVLAMAQSRFEQLTPPVRALLRAGSVFGDRFWKEPALLLAAATDDSLSAAIEAELVEPKEPSRFKGHVELSFRHALLREAAYHALTEDDRRLAHRAAAEWLERAGETDSLALAGHWQKSGERAKAAADYHRAAAQALEAGDFAAASERVQLALDCGLTGSDRTDAELLGVEAVRWGNNQLAFLNRATELLPRLKQGSTQWLKLAADVSVVSWRLKGYKPAVLTALGAQLLAVPDDDIDAAAFVRAGARLVSQAAIALVEQSVAALTERVERLSRMPALQEPSVQAWVEQMRAFVAGAHGDLAAAGKAFEASAQLFEAIGDMRNALAERVDRCFMLLECGMFDDLERVSVQVIAQSKELGLSRLSALVRVLGLYGQTQQGKARQVLDEMRATASELPVTHSHFISATILLAETELAAGNPLAALAAAERATRSANTITYFYPEATMARALLALGRPHEALPLVEHPPAQKAVLSNITGGYERHAVARALALEQIGLPQEARAVMRAARDELLVTAARIKEPAARESFVKNSPERAELLAIAQRWGV